MQIKARLRKHLVRLAQLRGYDLTPIWQLADRPLIRHLRALFLRHEIDCVFDVGANRGQYYDLIRNEVGFKGTVLSFEPVAQYLNMLKARALGEKGWEVFGVALGSTDSMATINVTKSPGLNSFLFPRDDVVTGFWRDEGVIAVETVEVKTLDGMFDSLQTRYGFKAPYLKLDTQGFDLEVIKGARRSIPQIRALQTEASVRPIYTGMPDYRETLSCLGALGFDISGMFPVSLDPALRLVEFDCVMVKAASVADRHG